MSEDKVIPNDAQHIMIPETLILNQIKGLKILDIGCGRGRWGYIIKQQNPATNITGIEIHEPYVKEAIANGAYEEILNQSYTDLSMIPSKSFDTVLAIETIEHVDKKEGRKLFNEIERIAKYRAIVTTPSGFYKLDPPLESEQHKCGWKQKEIEKLGYDVLSYRFNWEGVVSDKKGNPKCIKVNRDWLICTKEMM